MHIRKIAAGLIVAMGIVGTFHTGALAQANPSRQVACNPQTVAADAYAGLIIMNMNRPSVWGTAGGRADQQKNDLLVAALDFYLLIWEKCRLGLIADNDAFFRGEEIASELRLWVEEQKSGGGAAR